MVDQRTCVGCRRVDDRVNLVRYVAVAGEAMEATRPRLPGRGAYLHPGCFEVALKRRALERALGLVTTTRIRSKPAGS
ncbi:YlxR family protein [Tessaracoccus sp. OH4464_COT-324]|uniref:YlxR family protein n=1 Tax=Tessaracoccus sp. OH4464_COT-324 TaxID=2491059 RepID=UPI000F636B13|nr:YlxR family protein [Tessaracoccus sp. OH4464_COT-324]